MTDVPARQPSKFELGDAKRRLEQARGARQRYEPEWFLNMAYFQGDQWCAWNGRAIYRPNTGDRVTITDNRIRPKIRTDVARLSKARPGWSAKPQHLDDQAVSDAAASTRLLDWAWDTLKLAPKRREALTWSRIVGAGFIKTTWDSTINPGIDVVTKDGKTIKHPSQDRPLRTGEMPEVEGGAGFGTKRFGGGEVSHIVRSPFDIFPDPLATSLEDSRWLIDEAVRSPEYVEDRYKVRVSPDSPANVGIVESRYHSHGVNASQGPAVGVRVYEMWEAPSPRVPQGRHVVWHDGGILHEGPNDYGRIPYTMISGIVVPGRFWPDSPVSDMRPIQVRLNKLESQIAENIARTSNPALLLDSLQNIKVFGVPGEQIKHNAATPAQLPQYLSAPPVGNDVFNFLGQMEGSLDRTSGQEQTSNGGVPAGVTAASAISLLQEQSDTILGPDVEDVELAIADIGQQTMDLMARYYTTDRVIVLTGEDGIVDVDTWRGGAKYKTPVIGVVAMSTFPRSLAALQAATRDMLNMFFQYGIPIDQAALPGILRKMQVGGLDQLVQSYSADVQQVNRENVEFLRGGELHVRKVDNDAIHISGHEDFAKTARFQNLPPAKQEAYIAHIDLHHTQKDAKDMAAAPPPDPAAGGGPPAPPGMPMPDASTVPTAPSGNPLPSQIDAPPTM